MRFFISSLLQNPYLSPICLESFKSESDGSARWRIKKYPGRDNNEVAFLFFLPRMKILQIK